MRVLAVGSMYPPHDLGGGAELVWRQWVDYARGRGHCVRVLTTDFGSTTDADPDVVRALRWYWRDYDFPRVGWRERIALERHNGAVLDDQLADFAPDAVCFWAMGGMSLSLIERVRRTDVRAAAFVPDAWMVYGRQADRWTWPFRDRPRLAALAERLTGLPASVDMSTTTWLFCSDYLRRASGLDLPRTAVAYPGYDAELFRRAAPKEWDWDLLYMGRFDERKGVHLAIDALRHLPDGASLTLCGRGDEAYVESLRERAGGLDVRFLGGMTRPELPGVYAAADVVVFPVQWNEPWGLVPLEAMSVGRPVVASGTGGSAEYMRDGENCILYSPIDSAEALAAGVRRARTAELDYSATERFVGNGWMRQVEEALCGVWSIGAFYPPHDLGGGYEVTWRSSVEHLRAHGDEVRVIASDYRKPGEPDDDVHRELRMWWHDHGFPRLGVRERLAIERHNADVWRRHTGEFRPDVVCWWQFGVLSMSLIERARVAGLPAVGVVGDEWMVWGPRAEGWLRRVRRVDLGGAAEWLFNSDHTRQRSIAATGPLERTAIAHPGIDPGLFAPAAAKPWAWQLLYLGRLDTRKGVHIAIDAMQHLPAEATLTVLGSGDDDYVRRLQDRAGPNVRFARAARSELQAAYAAADAVLFPVHRDEPWGLVPIEAMSVGRPVVATGTGGGSEYMRDGENVLLMEPKDSPEALAAAVKRLAEDPALRARLVEGGRATAAPLTETAYNEAIRAALLRA